MRRQLKTIVLFAALAVMGSGVAGAQTPDGQTPANEGVCDDLATATPGLYGLCVGYCEAQDCSPAIIPEGEPQSCAASDRRLLDLYNQMKTPGDPAMPCVQVTCPCWTLEELESIDPVGAECQSKQTIFFFRTRLLNPDPVHMARSLEFPSGALECSYFDRRDPDAIIERIFRITAAELAVCKEQILNRCDELMIPVDTGM